MELQIWGAASKRESAATWWEAKRKSGPHGVNGTLSSQISVTAAQRSVTTDESSQALDAATRARGAPFFMCHVHGGDHLVFCFFVFIRQPVWR